MLEQGWSLYPDLRLGQFLINFIFEKKDCFYSQEDDVTERNLRLFLLQGDRNDNKVLAFLSKKKGKYDLDEIVKGSGVGKPATQKWLRQLKKEGKVNYEEKSIGDKRKWFAIGEGLE